MSAAMAADAGRPATGRMGGRSDQAGSGVIKVLRGTTNPRIHGPGREERARRMKWHGDAETMTCDREFGGRCEALAVSRQTERPC